MEQLYNSVIAMTQNVGVHQEKTPTRSAEAEDGVSFQDMMTKKQEKEACETGETECAVPRNGTEQEEPASRQESDLEEQLLAAAISAMQVPIVPMEQVSAAEAPTLDAQGPVGQVMPQAQIQAQNAVRQEIPAQGAHQDSVESVPEERTGQLVQNSQVPEEKSVDTGLVDRENDTAVQSLDKVDEVTVEEVGGEMPVFRDVKDVLVKVGETSAEESEAVSDTQLTEQIGEQVSRALEQGETRVTIRLKPERLGQVEVKLTLTQKGTLEVELRAESQLTQRLLEKESGGLQQMLMRSTQQDVQVQVTHQQESQQPFEDGGHGGRHQNPQQERRQEHRNTNDFLHQLRLGLIPLEGEPA